MPEMRTWCPVRGILALVPLCPPCPSFHSCQPLFPFLSQLTSLRYTTSMSEKCTWWPVRRMRETSSTLAHTCSRDKGKEYLSYPDESV